MLRKGLIYLLLKSTYDFFYLKADSPFSVLIRLYWDGELSTVYEYPCLLILLASFIFLRAESSSLIFYGIFPEWQESLYLYFDSS